MKVLQTLEAAYALTKKGSAGATVGANKMGATGRTLHESLLECIEEVKKPDPLTKILINLGDKGSFRFLPAKKEEPKYVAELTFKEGVTRLGDESVQGVLRQALEVVCAEEVSPAPEAKKRKK